MSGILLRRAMSDRVTLVRLTPKAARDAYGNPRAAEPQRTEGVPALLEQQNAEEQTTAGRDVQVGDWLLTLPAGTVLSGRDTVEHELHGTFEVVGDPEHVRLPLRGEHHVEARLRKVSR